MNSIQIFNSWRRHFLLASILSLAVCVPLLQIGATEAQSTTASASATNPNSATRPSDFAVTLIGWPKYINDAATGMKVMSEAVWNYNKDHKDQMPPDFGSLMVYFNPPRSMIDSIMTPGDERQAKIPEKIDADWVNRHASYIYIATNVDRAKIAVPNGDTPAGMFGRTVMFFTRLDQPFSDPNKSGDVIILTFLDGHSEVQPIEAAKEIIESSKKTLESARDSRQK